MKTPSWKRVVASHQAPILRKSIWQVLNSILPYLALCGLMIWSLDVSYWLTLVFAGAAAGFLIRIFIIFHDCAHGSFFRSQRANDFWGFVTGVLTFTPYHQWRHKHVLHHATSGDLDRRGHGDIWTMTVREYLEASRLKRFRYRFFRNPFVLFVVVPSYLFLIHQRFPSRGVARRAHLGVHWTNGALLAIGIAMSMSIGLNAYLLIQLPVVMITGTVGLWLFYVQHQFEGAYWKRREHWGFEDSALKGSSFYKLPRILQWFSGNIGFHHIHHLCPKIPNYKLQRCHEENPLFQESPVLGILASLKTASMKLWDEERGRMVGFRSLKREWDRH